MSMNAPMPQKFSFDLDLGHRDEKARLIGDSELASIIKSAEERAYKKGFSEGENTAANQAATDLTNAAKTIAQRTVEIAKTADQRQQQTLKDATDLAVGTGRKLAANLMARFPLAEIRSLIGECLAGLENVPHLVIRCHPDLVKAIEAEAQKQMKTSGFDGRLIIMGEPDIMLGDARLEWVDGG